MEVKTVHPFINSFTTFCKARQLQCMSIRCIEKTSNQSSSYGPYTYQPSIRLEPLSDQKFRIFINQWKLFPGTLDALGSCLPAAFDLTELSLVRCGLNNEDIFFLVKVLPTTHIRVLKLEDLDLPLAQYHLLLDTPLVYLSLRGNRIEDLQLFCQHLKTNQSIVHLNLSRNQLHRTSAEALFDALRTNSTLTSLSIAKNQLTDESILTLSKVLGKQTLSPEEVNIRKKHALEMERLKMSEEENEQLTKKKGNAKSNVPRTNSAEEKNIKRLAPVPSKSSTTKTAQPVAQPILSKDGNKEASQGSLFKHTAATNKKGRGSATNVNGEKTNGKRSSKKNLNSPEETLDELGSDSMMFLSQTDSDMFEINGQYYGSGNRTLMHLNLSHNWISLLGVKYLFEGVMDQRLEDKYFSLSKEMNGQERARSGLHRLILEGNLFDTSDPLYLQLEDEIVQRHQPASWCSSSVLGGQQQNSEESTHNLSLRTQSSRKL